MFQSDTRNPQTLADFQGGNIGIVAESFLVDRRAAGRTQGTIQNYKEHLTHFITYCDAQAVKHIHELSADFIRHYLLALAETHNPDGVHGFYRTVRAFLRWIELEEVMPADWRNPIHKVKAPKVPDTLWSLCHSNTSTR
jgi:site-specific recombinase XerD